MGRLTAFQTVAAREDVAAVLTEVIFQVMKKVLWLSSLKHTQPAMGTYWILSPFCGTQEIPFFQKQDQ